MSTVSHIPVMLQEVVENLAIPKNGRALDLTLGLGGHAEALLSKADSSIRYLGVDRDSEAREIAIQRLGKDERFSIIASTYEDVWETRGLQEWMIQYAPDGLDIVLADLGASSLQFKTPERGFSFMAEGPLDMRMDTANGLTALEWLEQQDETTLADILYKYGEERASRPISKAIIKALESGKLRTTLDLANSVYTVLPREIAKRKKRIDPATRTFQAIRIAVNSELVGLEQTIEKAVTALKFCGRIGIISFHSLEDRIVKQTFRRLAGIYDGPGRESPKAMPKFLKIISPGGIKPGETECAVNPPSRSARLRLAQRMPCDI
ncbi:MAG: 16S rRNA (cytosine(1402)-N(4))-methyltransferase RsmH [Holophagales bacterium]|jgi:16S rRNA (cytosine1402-N4)-methyltransferase|nr:16S rRNA (cytosine(1402)-N(4))-methyltransferase RsmH [Holophagales bacterium]